MTSKAISRRTIGITVAILVSTIAGIGGYWQYRSWARTKRAGVSTKATSERTLVRVEEVRRVTVQDRLHVTGTIAPRRKATVFSLVPGVVRRLEVQEGQTVKKGQILARLDGYKMVLAVQQARANRRLAKLKLSQTRTTFGRMRALKKMGAITQSQFDDVETAYKAAQLRVTQAQTGVGMAGARLSDALIRAPIDGVVIKRVVEQGDLMSSAQAMKSSPLLVIADVNVMKVEVTVAEKDLGRVHKGQTATATVDAYPTHLFVGKVTRISEMVDPVTRTANVTLEVQNRTIAGAVAARSVRVRPLKAGMFARVNIVVSTLKEAVVVPVDTLLGAHESPHVFLVRDHKAVRQPVTVGIRSRGQAQIIRGLTGGEQLIVLGHRMVRMGQPVQAGSMPVVEAEPSAAPVEKVKP